MGKVGAADVKPQVKVKPQEKAQEVKTASPEPATSKPELGGKAQAKAGLKSSFTTTQATFKPGEAAANPSQALRDLTDPKQRAQLASISQKNPVSERIGNHDDICGGASLVATMVLQSGTAPAAHANADALRAAFKRSSANTGLTNDDRAHIDKALDNLANQTLSKEDVTYLQQAAYAVGRSVPGGNAAPGLSTGAMANMVADLKGSGASFPPGTTFGQVFDGKGGHWVASAGKKFINTAPVETTKPAGKPQRTAADVTAQDITTSAPHFSGRVRVLDTGEVQVQSRYRKDAMAGAGAGWQATITPMDPRNDVQRVFQGNDKKLEQSFSSSVEGPLAK